MIPSQDHYKMYTTAPKHFWSPGQISFSDQHASHRSKAQWISATEWGPLKKKKKRQSF